MNRGLTLVETVAATALLTLIVGSCVPLLMSARRDLNAARPSTDRAVIADLELAVDALQTQRPNLIADLRDYPAGLQLQWEFEDRQYAAEASVCAESKAQQGELRSSHAWITFATDGVEVVRWTRLPSKPASEPSP